VRQCDSTVSLCSAIELVLVNNGHMGNKPVSLLPDRVESCINYLIICIDPCPDASVVEFGETIKNLAYRILQTEYSGCLDISAHA